MRGAQAAGHSSYFHPHITRWLLQLLLTGSWNQPAPTKLLVEPNRSEVEASDWRPFGVEEDTPQKPLTGKDYLTLVIILIIVILHDDELGRGCVDSAAVPAASWPIDQGKSISWLIGPNRDQMWDDSFFSPINSCFFLDQLVWPTSSFAAAWRLRLLSAYSRRMEACFICCHGDSHYLCSIDQAFQAQLWLSLVNLLSETGLGVNGNFVHCIH